MVPTPGRPDGAPERPRRWYRWLLTLMVATGIGASLAVSYALWRTAESQWITRSETEAQRLSTVLLGWMDESYAPLSGLAALVESSHRTRPEEFLNAFDGMESRAITVLLSAAAMLERDSHGRWVLAISSGNFEFLEREAADSFRTMQPVIDFALARRNQFVLGPPVRSENGQLMSPVVLALTNVKKPTVLVGKLEYASLETALLGTSTPKGFYLALSGKFMEAPEVRPIIQAKPDRALIERFATRAATGGADLEIAWGVTKEYANGPDYGLAAMALVGGTTATVLIALFVASLLERNRVINEKVKRATAALRVSGEEQSAILESATLGIAFIKDRIIMRANSKLDELFGFAREEQVGQPTRIWYPDDESHAAVGGVYEQLRRGETHQREQELRRKNGELFWCRMSGRAVQAGDLSQGTVWMLEDVTERRRADEEIKEARQKAEEATELVRHVFGRYVSEEVAESLLRAPEALDLGGEEREVSILMSDLRGFTAMASRLSPHEVIEVLNVYLEAMVDVVGRHQGTVDEIIGDAMLVIFGAPVACDDHAEKAVACGLAMQLAMAEVNRRLAGQGGAELEMGIGVHTGRVIVGNIGSLRRTKYTVVGANVNLAGRIESFTIGGQLLISEDTRDRIKAPLRIDGQYQVEPKGASRSLLLYEIGAIGEPPGLSLPSKGLPLNALKAPLPIRFTVLEEKFVGRTVHKGWLTAISKLEANMGSDLRPAVLSNLQISIAATPMGNPEGEIYGKVVESVTRTPNGVRIRFASVTPELKTWIKALNG
jgi:PAS domain S-box-containing protein